ncbi:MAG: LCP family protein [Acidimicrobiia bacterium]
MAVVVSVVVLATLGWVSYRIWDSWNKVERLSFDTEEVREALDRQRLPVPGASSDTVADTVPPPTRFDESIAFLIVGSDERHETDLSRRADVIIVFVITPDADPLLFSIPRDLWITNPCTGGRSRVNANLNGCGDTAPGPEQLAIAVEDFTGIGIDHFAVLGFDGFTAVVDRVGGVEICVENAVRDTRAELDLPAGCTLADGTQSLAWVRSRNTQEFVDGVWRRMAVDDLTRNQRQQDLVIQALARLSGFNSVADLSGMVDDLAGAFLIDDGLGINGAVELAWRLRGIDTSRIVRIVIPTVGFLSPDGESVLRPTEAFRDTLFREYPDAAQLLDS